MNPLTWVRSAARHRGKTVGQLRAECDSLACTVVTLTTENDLLRGACSYLQAENTRLERDADKAGIDRAGALDDLKAMTVERDDLFAEVAALRAYKANAEAIDVPPMERDTTAVEDQATGPIDVRPLWEALGTGPVAEATDPTHLPGQAKTREIPVGGIPKKGVA